jgi:RNA polymerase sigma-70 factor (ECF subfamily)
LDDIEALYRHYGSAIYRRALSILRDAQEATDVTQASFLAYMESRGKLRGEASPFTVLYQIATYQAVERVRHRARWSGVIGQIEEPEDNEAATPTTPRGFAAGLHQVEISQDLAMLTHGEKREVLTAAFLYYAEGHTTEEVAQVMGLSRKTIGRMLVQFVQRARKRQLRFESGVAT